MKVTKLEEELWQALLLVWNYHLHLGGGNISEEVRYE